MTDFRWKTKNLVDDLVRARRECNWMGKMLYMYPPRLAASDHLPNNVRSRLRDSSFVLTAKFEDCEVRLWRPTEATGVLS